jgi:methionyl aminopeptidase
VIQLKSPAEIETMRAAGLVVARTLDLLRTAVAPGVSTGDLDEVARESLRAEGAGSSFLGYHGFPAVICASVNDEIVHGIPDPKRVLREGDIVSLDFGAIIDGYHGDAAITVPVGEVREDLQALMGVTENALWAGFAAAHLGGRMTDISHAVEASVRRSAHPYGIVEEYVGHGIGTEMHQDPQVPNFGRAGRGPKLEKGLVLAIEPMVNLGTRRTRVLEDGWTVVTQDAQPSAHFEHTFTLTEQGPWVLTTHDGGAARLAALGIACGAPEPSPVTPQTA